MATVCYAIYDICSKSKEDESDEARGKDIQATGGGTIEASVAKARSEEEGRRVWLRLRNMHEG